MVNCLKVTVSEASLVEIGKASFDSFIRSVPLDCPDLPRLLVSEFPFPGSREMYRNELTKEGAQKLVNTYIEIPEAHELMFNVVIVTHNLNILDELQNYSHLYTPQIFSRGRMQQLTIDQVIRLQNFTYIFTEMISGLLFQYFGMLLDSTLSSRTIENDLKHSNTAKEVFLLFIESKYLVSVGFPLKLPRDRRVPNDLTKLLKGPVEGEAETIAWNNCYSRVVDSLKAMFPGDPAGLAYWWGKLVIRMIIEPDRRDRTNDFLERYFAEAAYRLAPLSLIGMLLGGMRDYGLDISQKTRAKLEDYFVTLHQEYPVMPYHGSDGKIALKAWRNMLCYFYKYDLLLPASISGYEDFLYYYGAFTEPMSAKISVAANLPAPIKIINRLCTTHACFLKHAQRLIFGKSETSLTSQKVITLAKRTIIEGRAIIRLLLTLLANSKYDPSSLPMTTVKLIVKSRDRSRKMGSLKLLIQESRLSEYVKPLLPVKNLTTVSYFPTKTIESVVVVLFLMYLLLSPRIHGY